MNYLKRLYIFIAVFFTVVFCCSLSTLHFPLPFSSLSTFHCLYAASSPMYRANEYRNAEVLEQAAPVLNYQWSFQMQQPVISSPVNYDGIVYFGSRDGSVWALNAYTGEQIWQYSTSDWVDSTPLVSSGTLYCVSRDGNVYAFNRLTGEIQWQSYTGSLDVSSPLLYNNKLYFLSGHPENKIYCLNKDNGIIEKTFPVSSFGFSSPAILNNYLYFSTNDGIIHCFNLASESMLWEKQTKGGIFYSNLAVSTSSVYAVSGGDERRLIALNPQNGNVLWQSVELDTKTAIISSVATTDDKVFAACTSGSIVKLYAFPLQGTTTSWSVDLGNANKTGILSSPFIANNVIYIGAGNGYLYCINTDNGMFYSPSNGVLSANPTGYFLPNPESDTSEQSIVNSCLVSNGYVYAATYDGLFYCFKASTITAITYPDIYNTIVDSTIIKGTITDPLVYSIEYGYGTSPSSWILLSTNTVAADNSLIGSWQTSALNDGVYSLRLTESNNTSRRAVSRVVVDNTPQPPSALTAIDTSHDEGNSLTLSWTKSPDDGGANNDIIGYRVYKSTDNLVYSLLTTVNSGTSYYIDLNCPVYQVFYYKISGLDSSSESSFSNTASAFSVLDGKEISPSSVNISTVTLVYEGLTTQIIISSSTFDIPVWIGIYVSTAYTNVTLPSYIKGTNIVREFTIEPLNTVFKRSVRIRIPYKTTDIPGLDENRLFIFRWNTVLGEWQRILTSAVNISAKYVEADITSFSFYRIMEYTPPATSNIPLPPTNLSALDTSDDTGGSINLAWTKSADDGSGNNDVLIYKVYRGITSGTGHNYLTQLSSGTTSFIDNSCQTNTTYYYVLTAWNSTNASVNSNEAFAAAISNDASPEPPTNVKAQDTALDEGGSITLTWGKSADDGAGANDVSSYQIYRSSFAAGVFSLIAEISSGTIVFVDTSCPVYTMYHYKLTAKDRRSTSVYSDTVNAYSEFDGAYVDASTGREISFVFNNSTTTVIIEADGLSNNAWIGIKIPQTIPEYKIPSSANATDVIRDFSITPSTTAFLKNITIKMPYSTVNAAIKTENLRIYWADTLKNSWRMVNTSNALSEAGRVWAVIPHFSSYRIMEYLPGVDALLSNETLYTYPNPAKGDKLFFKFQPGDTANIEINVYNVAGELIANLKKDSCPAGLFSEVEWNIKDIASGVYVYRAEAKTAAESKAIKKKLAIIH